MSRLRVPFRAKQSSNSIDTTLKEVVDDYTEPQTVLVEKGKEHQVERLWGIENFGNTCYCNSVLQALYACEPFREFVASYPDAPAPIAPLAPGPGEPNKPKASPNPSSPLAVKTGNPFDNPQLNGVASPSDKKRGLFGRRPTSSSSPAPASYNKEPTTPTVPILTSSLDVPPVAPNPDGPPPSVFETIQTLFHHLSSSKPHQPLPARKEGKDDAQNAQTASLLPSEAPATPQANAPAGPPPGPPLLASLPPPSAPRGGGPFQAGTLGRGVVRPEDLLRTVKRENEMFRGMSQQDAHEFLGWVLNKVAEDIEVVDRSLREVGKEVSRAKGHGKTFVQNLFEGVLTNETRCLSCETTSSRDELFLDLSIDIEQHSSVTACLRQFSASEMLCQKNKFFCDSCCGLQEAEKRMKIKRLPHVLALHLKRFKYQEHLGRYTKLFYRVPFPTQLRLPNTTDETDNPDRLYELFAVVVHIGNGPHHGHYVCLIRSGGRWVMCDDENVEPIDDSDIFRYFGDYPSGAGYVLFYQAVDLDLESLGLKRKERREGGAGASAATEEVRATEGVRAIPAEKGATQAKPVGAAEAVKRDLINIDETAEPEPIAFIQPRRAQVNNTPAAPVTLAPVLPSLTPAVTPAAPAAPVAPVAPVTSVASVAVTPPPPPPAQSVRTSSQATESDSNGRSKEEKFSRRKSTIEESTIGLGRKPSQQDRTVSASSQTSDKYSGGSGLSRRLSGMSIGRSGTFGKFGFGKKDKNGMGGVEEERK